MEKILNDDEKIKRAEELYFKRNNQDLHNSVKKTSIKDRFFLHLLIMLNIAIIVFCVQNKEFIFTQQFLNKLNEFNINISSNITNYIRKTINDDKNINIDNIVNDDKENNRVLNMILNNNLENYELNNNERNESNVIEEDLTNDNTSEIKADDKEISVLSDEDIDIKNLKMAYSFINPIKGVITSRFGIRDSENKEINGYHTGLDIASDKGTLIYASMQGIVDEVSSVGDYGNHVKIRCNNVTTLYAHCEKIYVTQGQIVAQGQTIGTVGSTGNSTGPHLHFEIRIDDRFINPEKILNI